MFDEFPVLKKIRKLNKTRTITENPKYTAIT